MPSPCRLLLVLWQNVQVSRQTKQLHLRILSIKMFVCSCYVRIFAKKCVYSNQDINQNTNWILEFIRECIIYSFASFFHQFYYFCFSNLPFYLLNKRWSNKGRYTIFSRDLVFFRNFYQIFSILI